MYTFNDIFPAEIVSVQGRPYLFTNMRVDRKTVPEGMYAYDVRDDCDGNFWQIQDFVMVNHWGTIVGSEPVEYDDEEDCYVCPPEEHDEDCSSEGFFIDYADNLNDYLDRYEQIKRENASV